jgi:glycosyltransferase involved in cell wall biosynthesis
MTSKADQTSSRDISNMTVLMLLTNTYDPDPRVRQEALTLISMGCSVKLLAWDRDHKNPEFQLMEGVAVERVHLASSHGRGTTQIFFYALLYLRMLWRGWKTPFDVVHCHDLDTLPLGYALGKIKRKPIVYDSHESFMDMLDGSVHPWVKRALMGFENFLIRRVDLLITVGEKLRRFLAARGARRTTVVGNWKILEEYERTDEQNRRMRRNLGIPPDAIVVTCITQLLQNRMIEELVEAIKPFPDVYAIIAGKGALEPQIRKWAAENPRVVFPGFIHASEVPDYTCASDAIYCGFDPFNPNARFVAPNKLYEALAAGKPLISPDVGEIGELIRSAGCGVVTPDCTAASVREAVQAMRDPVQRAEWARNSRLLGLSEMNWRKGREVLANEYSRLRPSRLVSTGGPGKPFQAAANGEPEPGMAAGFQGKR